MGSCVPLRRGGGTQPRGGLHVPRQQPPQARTLDRADRDRTRSGFYRLCVDRLEPGQERLVKAGQAVTQNEWVAQISLFRSGPPILFAVRQEELLNGRLSGIVVEVLT